MCGIIAVLGRSDVTNRLVEGLARLEYRGYDSAGIAVQDALGRIHIRRAVGKLDALREVLASTPVSGIAGLGHTRWATHGPATIDNAHPHFTANVTLVHNGIIENYAELKAELVAEGVRFSSSTDTEVVAHLLERLLRQTSTPEEAFDRLLELLVGSYALAVLVKRYGDRLFVARKGSPLAIGYGPCDQNGLGEMFVGSDALALAPFTDQIAYLEDGDRAVITRERVLITNARGQEVAREIVTVPASQAAVVKGPYAHFMLKEIHDQPHGLAGLRGELVDAEAGCLRDFLPGLGFGTIERVSLVACGTAHYACHVAQYWFESLAGLDARIDVASEYRYRDRVHGPNELFIAVSQSGETADTLAALKDVAGKVAARLAVVNVPTSSLAREADHVLDIAAGPEIGVASTKAFTAQLLALLMIAIKAGSARGQIAASDVSRLLDEADRIAGAVRAAIALEPRIKQIACEIASARDVIFLGRGITYPLALEAALKLKEVSYIHAEGYAAGELKHGPIALIDADVPVVVFASRGPLQEKTLANAAEVAARGARVVMVGPDEGADIRLAPCSDVAAPFAYAVVAQLLAYHTAVAKGTDVDQPRNLAKSVTVE